MSNYFVCASPYHVYLSLIIIKTQQLTNVKFYLTTNDKPNENFFKSIEFNLKQWKEVEEVRIRKRYVPFELLMLERIKDYYEVKSLGITKEDKVYLFPWNTHTLISLSNFWYRASHHIILAEEGTTIHLYPKPSELSLSVKKLLYGFDDNFIQSEKIKQILVQHPENFPMFPQHKLKKLPLSDWIAQLTEEDRLNIINVFANKALRHAQCQLANNQQSIIILTQPLSEDGYLSEEEKIQRYTDIVAEYQSTYQVFLKHHPRETTQYHFKDVIELQGSFPSELLELMNIKFEYAIGICTSAIDQIDAVYKINTDPLLLQNINNVKKRGKS